MKRLIQKILFLAFIAVNAPICLFAESPRKEASPNFLLIAVDDLNHYNGILSEKPGNFLQKVYPDSQTRSAVVSRIAPNIERLASQSTTFSNAFSPQPLCGPCRTAAFTGIPPHISGYTEHDRHFRNYESLVNANTLPQYLRQNGYQTIGLGKVLHKPAVEIKNGELQDWPDLRYSWDTWIERQMGMNGIAPSGRKVSPWSPEAGLLTYGANKLPAEQSWDYLNADFAAQLYRKGKAEIQDLNGVRRTVELPDDKPFLLAVGLFAPHLPWNAPERFYDRFPTEEMTGIDEELVQWVSEDVEDIPAWARKRFINDDFDLMLEAGERQNDPVESWRRSIQAYLAATAFADYCLGSLIDAVENSPRNENTVVMLFGDHGWQLGDKRRYRKHALWEAANHTTLIVRDPRRPASTKGEICDRIVSLQHLYPTIVSLADLPRPSQIYGRDMTPLLDNPQASFDERVLMSNTEGNNTLRTERYRYTRYGNNSKELYDMLSDPFEYNNLAGRKEHASLVKKMDRALDEMMSRRPEDYQ